MKSLWRSIGIIMTVLALTFGVACTSPKELEEKFYDNDEPYNIVYYMIYNQAGLPQDIKRVNDALNVLTKKKINATVTLIPYLLSEYTQKVGGAIAANVKWDLCATSPEINPYRDNVNKEAFWPLDWLLPEYAPETWKGFESKQWDQARVGGKIYGTINEQIFPRTFTAQFTSPVKLQEFLDENYTGAVGDTIYDFLSDGKDGLDFIDEYLRWMREKQYGRRGAIYTLDTTSWLMGGCGYDDLGTGMMIPGVVQINDGAYKVINQFESDGYRRLIDKIYTWQKDGFLTTTASYFDVTPNSTWKPGYLTGSVCKLSDTAYFTSHATGTLNAISSTSENPARVMKFIELLRTDKEIHNLLQYGIENEHYIMDPDDPNRIAEMYEGGGYCNSLFGWGLGSEFISYLQPGQPDDLWERTKELNRSVQMGNLIGFSFDPTNVSVKIAECQSISAGFITGLQLARYENKDTAINDFIGKLNAAGAQDIIAEKQKQLDEFLRSKAIK